jgi:hypothetical protein
MDKGSLANDRVYKLIRNKHVRPKHREPAARSA